MPEETKKEKEVKVSEKIEELIRKIEDLSVKELAELVKVLEEKFGISPQMTTFSPSQAPSSPSQEKPEEEKATYTLSLVEVGENKIAVIKLVRDITGKGLKESKVVVDATAKEPQVIKENVKKEEAEEIKKKFEEVGAKIELK